MRSTPARPRRHEAPVPPQPLTRRFARLALPALSALALQSCLTEPVPVLPDNAIAFVAPAQYADWWSRTEACSLLEGDMQRVEWYVVPDVATFATDQGEKVGIRVQTGDRIRIVLAGHYQMHEMVVRHEMLHALLKEPGHPRDYFVNRCALTWDSWSESLEGELALADAH
ncbi:MAG: hypothetical protein MUC69_01125 [Gemmatimonadales bacterium]|jgi:hypothetical protein|nr:hypothetical protein [Gemmatimonadales bacterium]